MHSHIKVIFGDAEPLCESPRPVLRAWAVPQVAGADMEAGGTASHLEGGTKQHEQKALLRWEAGSDAVAGASGPHLWDT